MFRISVTSARVRKRCAMATVWHVSPDGARLCTSRAERVGTGMIWARHQGEGTMSADQPTGPSSPPAVRLRRPGWRDTRFLVGLVLVALSVAMGAAAFSAAARTVPVLSLIHISEPTRLGMIS